MKYVVIEEGALDELVSSRFFQTYEYEPAQTLLALLTGRIKNARLPPNVRIIELADGIGVASPTITKDSHFLVIDVEQSRYFSSLSDSESIFVLQKTMRFARKIWNGLPTNFSELVVSQSTKAVLFPFSYQPKPYKVVLERSPWQERLKKRGHAGKFLLVYKTGTDSGNSKTEVAPLANFRKAYEELDSLISAVRNANNSAAATASSEVLAVTQIDDLASSGLSSMFKPYEDWLNLLTAKQRAFVNADLVGARRIEGAAGTGKTLCLMLKAVHELRRAEEENRTFHMVFVTHSEATKRSIEEFLSVIDPSAYYSRDRLLDKVSLKVCTLSQLCADQLAQQVSESEFVDRDAMESKETQLLYISEALKEAMAEAYSSHERFLSEGFRRFITTTDEWELSEMLQHEISVLIKGRASENIDVYKECPPLKYGIPTDTHADKGFVYTIFRGYQDKLGSAAQFDTDDVVLTTIGQLDTPVWRRRRIRDGYDAIVIDETHLFNINELHVFHYFTRAPHSHPILFSVDKTQAVGDRGWTNADISRAVSRSDEELFPSQLGTVFRSSPQIVDLALSVVSSGATLFADFDNPLARSSSGFTEAEERISSGPVYFEFPNDAAMVEAAFERADIIRDEIHCSRGEVLIVSLDRNLTRALVEYASSRNKPYLGLERRGDVEAVKAARESGKYVLGHADYVGGLEFAAVIIVGTDQGRLPPMKGTENSESKNFLSYSSHNRLYVAVSRARYRVELLGEKSRGPSQLLETALARNLLERKDG